MDTNDIIELGKSLEKKKELEKEVNELKLIEASLNQSIKVLKKAREEENTKLENDRISYSEEVKKRNEELEKLEDRRKEVIASQVKEREKLDNLNKEIKTKSTALENKDKEVDTKLSKIALQEDEINRKKGILSQIGELIKKI